MTLINSTLFAGIVSLLSFGIAAAADTAIDRPTLDQAYLAHWFSVDSAEPNRLMTTPAANDHVGQRAEIQFVSDDGQSVNGIIGYPSGGKSVDKLAFLLHPMGTDQHFWWRDGGPLAATQVSQRLRQQGYAVLTLDARRHGERGRPDFGPKELLGRAHSAEPRLYNDTIIGSVRDYRILFDWAIREFQPSDILAIGYSMGAQMSLLLASYESSINTVIAMVPPFVGDPTSPVAPRAHVQRINDARVLWLAGADDPHSSRAQTQSTFDQISTSNKTLIWFDAGHRLPSSAMTKALTFVEDRLDGGSQ